MSRRGRAGSGNGVVAGGNQPVSTSSTNSNESKVMDEYLADILRRKGQVMLVDSRRLMPGSRIRPVREVGVSRLISSIQQSGVLPIEITVYPAATAPEIAECTKHFQQLSKENEEFQVPNCDGLEISDKYFRIVDGQHRVEAVVRSYSKGTLKHPFIRARVMDGILESSRILMAFDLNEAANTLVEMTLFDYVTFFARKTEQLLKDGKKPGKAKGKKRGNNEGVFGWSDFISEKDEKKEESKTGNRIKPKRDSTRRIYYIYTRIPKSVFSYL
jgi:hypothetical protein